MHYTINERLFHPKMLKYPTMLLKITNLRKNIWTKTLFEGLNLQIQQGEKASLIGRNGVGKTTLFRMIAGEDTDFKGSIATYKETRIVMTQQEHLTSLKLRQTSDEQQAHPTSLKLRQTENENTVIDYILSTVPQYKELHRIVFGLEPAKSQDEYIDAITLFTEKGYYHIEDNILQTLESFQITQDQALMPLSTLSGGEKRFVELTRVMYSQADIALIDEPTNHMDSEGKQKFINWLNNTKMTVLVITHDRDVLQNVDKIIEIRDHDAVVFDGNYENYLKQNSFNNISSIHDYETRSKQIEGLQKKIDQIDSLGEISRALKIRRERFQRYVDDLSTGLTKPSFWIDQESLEEQRDEVKAKYDKYKERNITITKSKFNEHKKLLLKAENLVLGYDEPLFEPIDFELFQFDKLRLLGRNGVGKSTLIKHIIASIKGNAPESKIFEGDLIVRGGIKLGIYEQEISPSLLDLTLEKAIIRVHTEANKVIGPAQILSFLDNYLFDKKLHLDSKLKDLSGGEKARFQIMKMLVGDPNLLFLDEPTNHLDLPSIEVLERFLSQYKGAIIYVSHDSFFAKTIKSNDILIERKE